MKNMQKQRCANDLNQPKCLLVTRNLPPLIGGMERLLWNVSVALSSNLGLTVIGPKGCGKHLPEKVKTLEVPVQPLSIFLGTTFIRALKEAISIKPDIIFAGSGLTALPCWFAARVVRARLVTYFHGLDVEANHPVYRRLWHPVFRKCDLAIANSNFTKDLLEEIGLHQERIRIIHPGVDIPDWKDKDKRALSFRKRYGLGNSPFMLYVGRITPRKGLYPFVRKILPKILKEIPEARLVVIGDEPRQAVLGVSNLTEKIKQALEQAGISDNVLFLGSRAQNDPELSDAYFAADVLVFPVQEQPGDNEGFGMVAVEAAAHGTPTVVFNAGGVSDAVRDGVSGRVIIKGNAADFARAVMDVLANLDRFDCDKLMHFANAFSWKRFGRQLMASLYQVVSDFN